MKHIKFLMGRAGVMPAALFVCSALSITSTLWAQNPSGAGNAVSEEVTQTAPSVVSGKTTASGNVSVDFKDADINNVLRILSLKSQVNIVAGPEVKGTVTIRLEDVPWEKALDVVLRTYGYVYEREGNIVRVTTKDNISSEELTTETFILNYTTAAEVETSIKDILSERGRVKSVARSNMVVVTDIPTNLYKVREVIAKLDRNTPQAHIDSKIVKTQIQQGENLGIQWTPTVSTSGSKRPYFFPFAASTKTNQNDPFERVLGRFFPNEAVTALGTQNPFNPQGLPAAGAATVSSNAFTLGTLDFTSFSAVLNFLRTRENTKVVSNPRITVLNNQKAKIQVGTDVALPSFERNNTTGSFEISGFSYRSTGVVLEVTPHINNSNEILVDLKPEVSAQSGSTTFATTGSLTQIPNFSVTNAQTQVLIKNGETIAIGGLMTDSVVSTENKVPILGDIPGIGKIFRSKRSTQGDNNSKVETLFFITVTIVDTEGEPTKVTVPQTSMIGSAPPAGQAQKTGETLLTANAKPGVTNKQSGSVEKV